MENGNQGSMILIVQINNQKFHYFEFVKPIEDILKREGIKFDSVHYKKLYEKVIYNNNSNMFLNHNIYLPGICYSE